MELTSVLTTTNVVVQSSVNIKISLRKLMDKITNAKYNPSKWSGLSWSHPKISGTIMLFPNGTLICNGTKSFAQARQAVRQYARLLQRKGYHVKLSPVKLVTMSMLSDLGQDIDLKNLSQCYPGASWEPELFNGCSIKKKGVHFTVFSTGKVVICGVKSFTLINSTLIPTLVEITMY